MSLTSLSLQSDETHAPARTGSKARTFLLVFVLLLAALGYVGYWIQQQVAGYER